MGENVNSQLFTPYFHLTVLTVSPYPLDLVGVVIVSQLMGYIMQDKVGNRQAFISAAEKAGIKIQYYLDTRDESYMDQAISYIKSAYILIKEMRDKID